MRIPSFATRMALVAATITAGALLSPALPAQAISTPQCTIENSCDILYEYFADATYTVRVGEFENGPCGHRDNGVHTRFVKEFRQVC